jgi:hypothetical protein
MIVKSLTAGPKQLYLQGTSGMPAIASPSKVLVLEATWTARHGPREAITDLGPPCGDNALCGQSQIHGSFPSVSFCPQNCDVPHFHIPPCLGMRTSTLTSSPRPSPFRALSPRKHHLRSSHLPQLTCHIYGSHITLRREDIGRSRSATHA